ncbi:hypothetical protein CVP04_09085 [Caviibacterium pharyngocola]|uniref:Uncharacterized protein n=2 Tax=Caviibacterium pharyngocola TaxID=28159 RepID=A0A2M8RUB8_9PAST|nr:hypothetical protein CVP04_09085 [Caviibacterium pharyngocola]
MNTHLRFVFELQAIADLQGNNIQFLAQAESLLTSLEVQNYRVLVQSNQLAQAKALGINVEQITFCNNKADLSQFLHNNQVDYLFLNQFHDFTCDRNQCFTQLVLVDHQDNLLPEPQSLYVNSWQELSALFTE